MMTWNTLLTRTGSKRGERLIFVHRAERCYADGPSDPFVEEMLADVQLARRVECSEPGKRALAIQFERSAWQLLARYLAETNL
jgi:hypothetical protein